MILDDDFIDLVIKEVKNFWPDCQMVRGSPRHSESNGGVERVNQTVQKKLGGWMKTNNSKHWSIGCKIVQWRINTQIHDTLKDTPYHLTYGQHPWVGISNLPVSITILEKLATEAELQDVYLLMNSLFNEIKAPANESSSGSIMKMGKDNAPVILPLPLIKRKERSPQELSGLLMRPKMPNELLWRTHFFPMLTSLVLVRAK